MSTANLNHILVFIVLITINFKQCQTLIPNNLNLLKNVHILRENQTDVIKSTLCKNQIGLLFTALQNGEKWAYKMVDATSKLQSGLLVGNLADLGSFDQCIGIKDRLNSINGKYCLLKISIDEKKPYFRSSLCIPDGCTSDDMRPLLTTISETVSSLTRSSTEFTLTDDDCQTLESQFKLETGDYVVIAFLAFTLLLMAISTIYDLLLSVKDQKPPSPLLVSFSVYSNGKRLFKVNRNKDLLPCLDGIRFLSMLWIIMGHRFEKNASNLNINTLELEAWSKQLSSQFILNSSMSVDSFFLLSGCLLMYGYLKAKDRGIPFNIILYYLHRYLRVTPALAVVMIVHVTLNRHFGSGPLWPSTVKTEYDNCKQYWWSSLLYVQNYVNPEQFCVGQSWYLSVDMQLFWLSPLILIPISKCKRFTLHILTVLTFIFICVPFYLAWSLKLKAVNFDGFIKYYVTTHGRAGSWLVGLILGHILYIHRTKKVAMDYKTVALGWILSLTALFYIILGVYPEMQDGYVYDKWFNSFYIALHRIAWCVALSWIAYACVHGYGGPVNAFLSLPTFQILSRLTYCMYLTHVTLIYMKVGKTRVPIHFSFEEYIYMFWGDVCTTLIVSLIWALAFEFPWAVIDSVLIGKAKKAVQNKNVHRSQNLNNAALETTIEVTKETENVK